MTIDDADKFVGQATQYSAANDSPIAMLTVLDDGPKTEPPGVASNYMRWAFPAVHGVLSPRVPSMVVVVVIPIGSPSPSSWSRRTASDVQHGG